MFTLPEPVQPKKHVKPSFYISLDNYEKLLKLKSESGLSASRIVDEALTQYLNYVLK